MTIADWIGNVLCGLTLALLVCVMTVGTRAAWRTGHRGVKSCVCCLLAAVLFRFGGEMLLEWNEMGWRTTPRNWMDVLWLSLLLLTIYQTMAALTKAGHPWSGLSLGCGWLLILVVLLGGAIRFHFFTWTDQVVVQNGAYVVMEREHSPGSIGGRRCFLYVNELVHGQRVDIVLQ